MSEYSENETKKDIFEVSFNSKSYKIYLPDSTTDYIQGKIAIERKPYELEMLKNMGGKVSKNGLVLDVGANIGNHTLYLSAVVGCQVVAFEPNSSLVRALQNSVNINGFNDLVTIYNCGLGGGISTGSFEKEIPGNLGAQRILLGNGDIEVRPLDDIKFDKIVDIIKIDVEGMELDVLAGGRLLIDRDKPLLYIECKTEGDFTSIYEWVKSLGYRYDESFNATPTHLFIHDESVGMKSDARDPMLRTMCKIYELESQVSTLRKANDLSNKKYRESNDRIDEKKYELSTANKKYIESKGRIGKVENELSKANEKYRDSVAINVENERRLSETEEQLAITTNLLDRSLERCRILEKRVLDVEDYEEISISLNKANEKYRDSVAINVENERRLSETEEQLAITTNLLDRSLERCRILEKRVLDVEDYEEISISLNKANEKYRQVTREVIPSLKERLSSEQRRVEVLGNDLKKSNSKRLIAEKRVAEIRSSFTFKLGYQVRGAAGSWKKMIKLPIALWRIYKQAKKRNDKRKEKLQKVILNDRAKYSPPDIEKTLLERSPPQLLRENEGRAAKVANLELVLNKPIHAINMACIMDDFTYRSYNPECNLFQLTPDNWVNELTSCNPDLLFIESAWRGKNELWGGKVSHKSKAIVGAVEWCNSKNIPAVFWNKEDPVHFETFLTTAMLFDVVFTTDIDCIQRYKSALGHDRVYLLPFACQPVLNNPIEKYQRKDGFCFAGAYYVRYPERTADLEEFVTELPKFAPLEIYDRNFGKNDENYQFPEAYRPFIIGTLPFIEIDKAYKGYQYAINLNSIKQSQTMFARRIFELLASNTITISNYSRGLRLLFGDLVVTTDSGDEAVRRLESFANDKVGFEKVRLAGLRKVMLEHTYAERLAYVLSRLGMQNNTIGLPDLAIFSPVKDTNEANRVILSFIKQKKVHAGLILLLDGASLAEVKNAIGDHKNIQCIEIEESKDQSLESLSGKARWLGLMHPSDYYGSNYLLDLILATRYSSADVIGKASFYGIREGSVELNNPGAEYQAVDSLSARSALVNIEYVGEQLLGGWTKDLGTLQYSYPNQLAVDSYNYCYAGAADEFIHIVSQVVDDLHINEGVDFEKLTAISESVAPLPDHAPDCISYSGEDLADIFGSFKSKAISTELTDKGWDINSRLQDGKHEYIYSPTDFPRKQLEGRGGEDGELKFHLEMEPGLNISVVFLFLDQQKRRISHVIKLANHNHTVDIPVEAAFIRFGLRVYSGGSSLIKGLLLGHRNVEPTELIGQSETLLLTNHYPSYNDLYRNGFVHSRVMAYKALGIDVDVFRMRKDESISWHEFQDVDVTTGSQAALHRLLASGRYKHVLVHFLDSDMWAVLSDYIETVNVTVWLHGAEIHPWYRRKFNFDSDDKIEIAKVQSEKRMSFWQGVLNPMPKNLNLVYVSKSFSKEVAEDTGLKLPEEQYHVIHNPIDTSLFNYVPKPVCQRNRFLSIRPFASRQYANDLSVELILALSKKDYFSELEFLIIGDGVLFEETVAPLEAFDNVVVQRRFLSQLEIASLHKEYGLFLCPTRWDSQGVSRDEAMSSGLIPVTTRIAAVPEFVDGDSGILGEPERVEEMVVRIDELQKSPEEFEKMSLAAAQRVRMQSKREKIVVQEADLFRQNKVDERLLKLKQELSADSNDEIRYKIYYQLYEILSSRRSYEEALICLEVCADITPEKSDELKNSMLHLKQEVNRVNIDSAK